MPLYDFKCLSCGKTYEAIVKDGENPRCPDCDAKSGQRKQVSYAGGYKIKGNNSASVTPKRAGGGK